jgi:hypothetical protein
MMRPWLFSRDIPWAIEVAKSIRTGTVWINDYHLLNALAPFGGYKQSGVGRELGPHGLLEYTQVKQLLEKLKLPISVLDPSARAENCLAAANIQTLGDLVKLTETDVLKIKNFGKTSMREVKKKLGDLGLTLGMEIPAEAPPQAPDNP